MKKSVLFRKFIMIFVITTAVSTLVLVSAYTLLSKDRLLAQKINELSPIANAVALLTTEHLESKLDHETYLYLCKEMASSVDSYILIVETSYSHRYLSEAVDDPEFINDFKRFIATDNKFFSGERFFSKDLKISGKAYVCTAAHIYDDSGTILGNTFVLIEQSRVFSNLVYSNYNIIISALISLPFATIVPISGVIRALKPTKNLIMVAKEVSQGNYEAKANEKIDGEFGTIARAINTMTDRVSNMVREVRVEKRQLNQIIAGLSDGIAAIDTNGRIMHYNPALMNMFGAVGVSTREELVPHPEIWEVFDAVLEADEVRMITYHTDDGRAIWITVSTIYDDENNCSGAVGLFKDSTEAERLDNMRKEYIANISHEFRTPLTAIRGLLEPLSDNMVPDDETKQRYYNIMLDEVGRLSRLISDMMTISKLQSNALTFELEPVNVAEKLKQLAVSVNASALKKNIEVVFEVQEDLAALTDNDRLSQVLVILTDNAIKYTKEGGKVAVSAKYEKDFSYLLNEPNVAISNPSYNSNKCKDKIIISITDNGVGIPSMDLQRIFERFYTVSKSRTKGSTGLGLSIAQQILEALGETLIVKSVEDKGSTFMITLTEFNPIRDKEYLY
ncbi:MAG: PAS domain-containing protein [Clostridiales bacterium]|nr:PAS domain-containing protein [Clostridiales bacterium]